MAQIKNNLFYIFVFMVFERKEKTYPIYHIQELDTYCHKLKPQYRVCTVYKAHSVYKFTWFSKGAPSVSKAYTIILIKKVRKRGLKC